MKIQEYLKSEGVYFSEHDHAPAYTAQEIAAEEHVSGDMMAKPVMVRADDGYAMCVLPASYKLDTQKVRSVLKVKSVRLADEQELAKLFPEAEVGAESPFGNLHKMRVILDQHLARKEQICFQADSHRKAIRMSVKDYIRLVRPEIEDIAVHL